MIKNEIGILFLVVFLSPLSNSLKEKTDFSQKNCISEDFNIFYAQYISDIDIQKEYTIFQLIISTTNKSDKNSKNIKLCNEEDLLFPILKNSYTYTDGTISILNEKYDTKKISIKISRENTKTSATYHFINKNCWNLYMIEYESL
ncbi:hypothetical protein [Desulfomicrobium salsuginis]